MKRVVVADSHEIFRIGIANTISTTGEYRVVAHCRNSARLLRAITAFPGCIAVVAACLQADLEKLHDCLQQTASTAIAIVEDDKYPDDLRGTFQAIISRDINPAAVRECLRQVERGQPWIAGTGLQEISRREDLAGMRVRDGFTAREMRIAALLVQGRRNREIATRLGAHEHTVKNCLRRMYEKSGTSDRLEMVMFVHNHEALAEAVAATAKQINAEALDAHSIAVA